MANNVFVEAANETFDKYITKTLEGNRSKIIMLVDNWLSRKLLLIGGAAIGANATASHDALHQIIEGTISLILILVPSILSYKNDKINKMMRTAAVNVAQQVVAQQSNGEVDVKLNPLAKTLVTAVANANIPPNTSF